MDLTTTYMGLRLPHPFMPGASPMVDDIDWVRRLEDAGAAAVIMHSLFEEQITREQLGTIHYMELHDHSFAEALSYFPTPSDFRLGPQEYLEQIRKLKETVAVPVIASLNGMTGQGWVEYAQLIQQAGADGLELNVYFLSTNREEAGVELEDRVLDIVREVKKSVAIPVAVKLSPFYSSLSNFASKLDELGVDGLVLFNRFYQPDIDLEGLEVVPKLNLSTSAELLLRLRWAAILAGRVRSSLGISGGVHTAADAVKAILAGGHAVQLVSSLLEHGPAHLGAILDGTRAWFEDHEYSSLSQARGSMSLERSPNPAAFERANYMRVLQSYHI
jgi:dihydroorotate dehydrogenase (fumarate)